MVWQEESGVYMDVLKSMLGEAQLDIPFLGLDESDYRSSLEQLEEFLDQRFSTEA